MNHERIRTEPGEGRGEVGTGGADTQDEGLGRPDPAPADGLSRREFIGCVGGLSSARVVAGLAGLAAVPGCGTLFPIGVEDESALGPLNSQQRAQQAYRIRVQAARFQKDQPLPAQQANGDESAYPTRIANYSKGLPHDALGQVDPAAYAAMLAALEAGQHQAFESIPMGCSDPVRQRKLVNPQAGLAFDLQGADSHHLAIPPAPALASAEQAGELVELYWMALLRDVPFAEYETNALALQAADELSAIGDFRGPKFDGRVTPGTLFRGSTAGDLVGPYISQFLWRPVPFGSQFVEQRMRTVAAGLDYMTPYDEWLNIQNGCLPGRTDQFEPARRYIINGRDLGQWVHVDVLFQAYFNALLILLTPPEADPLSGGIGAPVNPGNPYLQSRNQAGFGTFGPPYFATLVCEVATRALKAVWYQKWFVHRRLRPEAFAGRVHHRLTGAADYPVHQDALNSQAAAEIFSRHGTYLLPQAYPEGSPLHPSYGAGHATVAGACVTILKALFDESYVIPNPRVPDPADPTSLVPYDGPPLTVGGELNKLAANVATGRNFAGIHWRSDYSESVRLGEAVALSILHDQRITCTEDFEGYTFTTFEGVPVTT